MARRIIVLAVAALLITPVMVSAQEDAKMSDSAMMAEWAKYANPGPEHKMLAKGVGKWTLVTKMWMDPSQPAMESKGTMECVPVLDGRFFQSVYKGDMMGMPFEGISVMGYDLYKKQYIGTWMDNMGTMIMISTGTANADGSECTMMASFDDPATKTTKHHKQITRWTGPDTFVFEMYEVSPGQPDKKGMEIVHTRVK